MTRATLTDVLLPALAGGYAVPGFVCLGWEDIRAYALAAQDCRAPVILQAGPGCRAHTPLPVLAAMMGYMADAVDVPVVLHLDHATSADECRAALDAGFTSVMIDGSRLPLDENIALTASVTAMAHAAGASCEGEVGFVGYAGGTDSRGTDPADAARFARETAVDAIAISVGNVHLQQTAATLLDIGMIRGIEAATPVPLVIHGGSGIAPDHRASLAATTRICKFNIGTELRMAFGAALRDTVMADPAAFDRIALLSATEPPLIRLASRILHDLGAAGRC